jgi:hypothetical protein
MNKKDQLHWDIAHDLLQLLREESHLTAISHLQYEAEHLYFADLLRQIRARDKAKKMLSKTERE